MAHAESDAPPSQPPSQSSAPSWAPSLTMETDSRGRALARFSVDAPRETDITPLLLSVSRVLRAAFAANIDAGGHPPFADLSPRTVRRKMLKGYPLQPLVATRLLRNSLARRGGGGNVTYVSAKGTLVVGSSLAYAAVHQTGGGRGIPARPYLTLSEGDWGRIGALIAEYAAAHPPE